MYEKHTITNMDTVLRRGDCSLCGPVDIRVKSRGMFLCVNKIYENQIRFRYGVDLKWYDERLIELGNRCACCGEQSFQRKLVVDHCHRTGSVRDLICEQCNLMLGHSRDNAEYLRKGAAYLERRN